MTAFRGFGPEVFTWFAGLEDDNSKAYFTATRDRYEAEVHGAVDDERAGSALAAVADGAEAAGLALEGSSLRTAPRGFGQDHPRIELLRRKALIAGARLAPAADGIGHDATLEHVGGAWRAAGPLNAWLDEHVGPSGLEPRGRR